VASGKAGIENMCTSRLHCMQVTQAVRGGQARLSIAASLSARHSACSHACSAVRAARARAASAARAVPQSTATRRKQTEGPTAASTRRASCGAAQ
jgi:hypothetical protein